MTIDFTCTEWITEQGSGMYHEYSNINVTINKQQENPN